MHTVWLNLCFTQSGNHLLRQHPNPPPNLYRKFCWWLVSSFVPHPRLFVFFFFLRNNKNALCLSKCTVDYEVHIAHHLFVPTTKHYIFSYNTHTWKKKLRLDISTNNLFFKRKKTYALLANVLSNYWSTHHARCVPTNPFFLMHYNQKKKFAPLF